MKKIILMILIIILVGCKGTTNGKITDVDNIYKGIQGLAINFLEQNQIKNIYEDSEFQIDLSLENKGASNIENGLLVVNLEKDYMKFDKWDSDFGSFEEILEFNLNGKSLNAPIGDSEIISLIIEALRFPESERMSELHTPSLYIIACYDYKTQFADTICIDTDVYERKGAEKSCKIEDKSYSDQGAPLAIIKIEPRMMYSRDSGKIRPQFVIYLENKGNGEILNINSISKACSSNPLQKDDINVVKINAYLSGKQLSCEPKEEEITKIRLKDKQGKVICTFEQGLDIDEGTYSTPLQITAEYGYTFTISKEIEIKRLI